MTISVVLKGRLGNQLFQYATLRSIGLKNNYNITININFEWHGQKCLLHNFNIPPNVYSNNNSNNNYFIYKYNQPGITDKYGCFNSTVHSSILTIQDNTLLEGHFENEDFFKEHRYIITNELVLKDDIQNKYIEFINNIKKNNDNCVIVGIHIRRGDVYSQNSFDENNVFEFINKSIEFIKKKNYNFFCILFIGGSRVSNGSNNWVENTHEQDIDWLNSYSKNFPHKNIISPGTLSNNELLDFSLLTLCDYNILTTRSTFSWMAAYVNKNNNTTLVNKNCMLPPAEKFIVL
jgi:hypothetical protein